MKTLFVTLLFLCAIFSKSYGQEQEIAQLLLNVEKLTQFKRILSDMKDGYKILEGGYNTVKDISKGNFNIHKQFLDGLLDVSPAVKKYRKVPLIIDYQVKLLKEYKVSFSQFRQTGVFKPEELNALSRTYSNIIDQSVNNLHEFAMIITAGKLRMSDDERIGAIDRIFAEMEEKLLFLRHFNKETSLTVILRQKEKVEIENLKILNK